VIYRELEASELCRVPPEATAPYAIPREARVFAAINDEGDVVAAWCLTAVAHAEPLWVREDHRNHPVLLRRLWKQLTHAARSAGVTHLASAIMDDRPVTQKIAQWTGAQSLPAKFYVLPLVTTTSVKEE